MKRHKCEREESNVRGLTMKGIQKFASSVLAALQYVSTADLYHNRFDRILFLIAPGKVDVE